MPPPYTVTEAVTRSLDIPSATFDSHSKRFPTQGGIFSDPKDVKPGYAKAIFFDGSDFLSIAMSGGLVSLCAPSCGSPGNYDPFDSYDWMLDTRRCARVHEGPRRALHCSSCPFCCLYDLVH